MLLACNYLTTFFAIVLSVILTIYFYIKWSYRYWSNKGVQTPPPTVPFGNAAPLLLGQKRFDDVFHDIHKELRAQNLKFGGMYLLTQKVFIPLDLELIKNLLLKDFNHFVDHGFYVNEELDPLTGNLVNLEGEAWRSLRQKLTPTFTSGKIKNMFQMVKDCSLGLETLIKKNIEGGKALDVRETLICYTTDIIGCCAFGVDFKTMQNPNNDFRKFGKAATEPPIFDLLKNFLAFIFPSSFLKKCKLKVNNPEMSKFFIGMVHDTVRYREENNVERKDLLQLLIDLKNSDNEATLNNNRLAAQAFIFYIGGFETSATTVTFALYELALNPEVQKKAREEIKRVLAKNNGEVTYESLMEMKYLEQVISETLRMYPPFGLIFRRCNEDYQIPGTKITIEKGNNVFISVLGLHYDHEYYPNPTVFDPERFTEENKAARPNFTWLPFGDGPRVCIGMRFGIMQIKMGLVTVLNNYEVTMNKKTKIPLQFDVNSIMPKASGGVWLDLHQTT